jgi:hypothetical protein
MYTNSGTLLDVTLSDLIDLTTAAIVAHTVVMQEFVNSFKELRQKEVNSFRFASRTDSYGDEPKPCLMVLISRHRPVSEAQHIVRYFPDGDTLNISTISLAKVSGKYTKHIPLNSNQKYSPKQIVRMKDLRFQHKEQREWTMSVIEQLNDLNASARELRDTYLSVVNMHYNIHKVASVLSPSNFHLKLKTQ